MKNVFKSILFFTVLITSSANAAFINAYDVSNWTQSIDSGSIDTSGAPNSVVLTSSNIGFGNRNQDFTIAAAASGIVTFDWSYATTDVDGSGFDPFGSLLNGLFTQLTVNGSFVGQSGIFSFAVSSGDIFGFRANATDSALGSATTTISNFNGPNAVPVPAAIWLMSVPLMGLLGKKRKASA